MIKEPVQEGGCLCGAVRYRIEPPTSWCAHCHCTICRRANGAAFTTWLGVRDTRFQWTAGEDGLVGFESSPGATRHRCGACGTPLTLTHAEWFHQVHVVAATVDGAPYRKPSGHLFVEEAASWVVLDQELPRFGGAHGSEPQGFHALSERLNTAHTAVRLATRWDAYDLVRLYREHAEVSWQSIPEAMDDNVRGHLATSPGGWVFVCELEREVVGFCDVKRMPAVAKGTAQLFVDDLYVQPSARRKGLGKALLSVVRAAANAVGAATVFLHVGADNEGALAFYSALGLQRLDDCVFTV